MPKIERYPTFTGKGRSDGSRSYVISPEDAKTVDFAIKLGRPLLVEGEAGCGKTRLADAVVEELKPGLELDRPIVTPVRSSSRANDLFYRYNALMRLQDAQIKEKKEKAQFAHNYVTLEPLGEAIRDGKACVALIDEVDKGDIDFQNDLLHHLDRFEFPIDEIPESEKEQANAHKLGPRVTWPGGLRPIVIFTSNREKPLPKPFLRRCIYLELKFPERRDDLIEIVEANLRRRRQDEEPGWESLEDLSRQIVERSVDAFLQIREAAEETNAFKKPATAELIDWIHALHWERERESDIEGLWPPHWKLLFRSGSDQENHENLKPRDEGKR